MTRTMKTLLLKNLVSEYVCVAISMVSSFRMTDKSEDESEPEDEAYEEEDQPPPLPKGQRNSQLTVGYKGDRSYVVRGNNIGVFSHTGDNVRYHATIGNLVTPKGKEFNPKEVFCSFLLLRLRFSSKHVPIYFERLCFTSKMPRWC